MNLISEGLIGVNLVKPCVYVHSRGLVGGGKGLADMHVQRPSGRNEMMPFKEIICDKRTNIK